MDLVQHNRPSVENTGPVIQMKCGNRNIFVALDLEIAWLQVHVRRLHPASANLLKHFMKVGFEFGSTMGAFREAARIKYSRVVGKKYAESIPVEIVEGLDEALECAFW